MGKNLIDILMDFWLLFTGRHFWNRKCRKKTWWQQEFAVFNAKPRQIPLLGTYA